MAYTTIDQTNVTGIEGLFTYVAQVVPIFIPLLLFAVFMITMLGSFFSQKRLEGKSDFLSSFAVAAWFTTIIAFVLSLVPNLVNLLTISVCIVTSVISAILLLTSGDRSP